MVRSVRTLAAAMLLGSAVVVAVAANPAAAAGITATTSGTVVTVTMTGDTTARIDCDALDRVFVTNVVATPTLACEDLTSVHVNGDSGQQSVYAEQLDRAVFTQHPNLVAHLGDGADFVSETAQADTIDLGPGDDTAQLYGNGVANTSVSLGTGTNSLYLDGIATADTMTATSTGPNVSVVVANSTGTRTVAATTVSFLRLNGNGGGDTINANGITGASTIDTLILDGGTGANTLTSTVTPAYFVDDGGPSTFTGSPQSDQFHASGPGDVIHGGGGVDSVYDDAPGPSGRAFSTTAGGTANWYTDLHGGDAVARIRPAAGGASTLVASLNRPGIAALPSSVTSISAGFSYVGALPTRNLADLVLPGSQEVSAYGDSDANDLADVTVPSGAWTTTGTPATTETVHPAGGAYGTATLSSFGAVSVHGPWTDRDQGFAHRVTRDLVFRFLSDADRITLGAQLTAGTKTRASVVAALMGTDEYRGLDVDRVFRRFLKRQPDASGRTYWIHAIANGRSLRKFRAQLFGSNEYYVKAGSTTEGFVEAAYADALGRAPDPSGLAYWTHKIEHGTERGALANSFLVSTEARRGIVKDQFLRFLDRLPTTAEVDRWMEPLHSSATGEQDLIAFLANSKAYYDEA